jgi:hypothetical protein
MVGQIGQCVFLAQRIGQLKIGDRCAGNGLRATNYGKQQRDNQGTNGGTSQHGELLIGLESESSIIGKPSTRQQTPSNTS